MSDSHSLLMGCGMAWCGIFCAASWAATHFPASGGRTPPPVGWGSAIRLWLGAGCPGDEAFSTMVEGNSVVAGRARLRCQIAEDDENRGQM